MKIQLENLPHQDEAIKKINEAFTGVELSNNKNDIYSNPLIKDAYNEESFIDIKMETGTGKTFVYTQMMYELHKQGLFKFVIVVPTPSIKEGSKSFLTSNYAKRYFNSLPGYENVNINLNEINAGDFSSKKFGRKNIPVALSEFIEATNQNVNQINVLLINAGMLSKNSGLMKSDFDQTLLGGITNPIKAIADIKPVVIIDEPHRFPKNGKYYEAIEKMKPELIVRFGATFPKKIVGRGKNREEHTDYFRGYPQYNLNAIDSFNQGLVKAVDIFYPDIKESEAKKLYKVKRVNSKELVLTRNGKEKVIEKNESLSNIDEEFSSDISFVGRKELSNGLELQPDMKLIPGTFSQTYQDRLIEKAIQYHLDIEEENFIRRDSNNEASKVKTNSLFFIDSISSFRGLNHEKGWLAKHFEKALERQLQKKLDKYNITSNERENEYKDFIRATIKSLKSNNQQVYAGYFSEDRGSGDSAIQSEVEDILKNKEKLLSFKDKKGNWITRRFLFSKWTLREGWDNPNVFVITKLRTSGSEISKIQEVGRGLRLPVDEFGRRLQQDEFESRLSFLIGYDEKDFAEKLTGEINEDTQFVFNEEKLDDKMINFIKKNRPGINENDLIENLINKKVIDYTYKFLDATQKDGKIVSGYEKLTEIYPEILNKTQVSSDKIQTNKSQMTKVKLNKKNWKQLKTLWDDLSKRKMIRFDDSVNGIAEMIAKDVFKDNDDEIFVFQKSQMIKQRVSVDKDNSHVSETKINDRNNFLHMNYGEFLKQISLQTDLPINLLNELMIKSMKKLDNDEKYINELTLKNIVKKFNEKFNKKIKNAYSYEDLDFSASTSIFDKNKNDFVDDISANDLGTYSDKNVVNDEKYLYERPPLRYDSTNPELEILKRTYGDEMIVYGKLPKRSIKIPRFDNGTTTPDFIFKINSGKSTKYLIIETKADNMRIGDETIRSIQKNYFDDLKESGVYYKMATSEQKVVTELEKLKEEK